MAPRPPPLYTHHRHATHTSPPGNSTPFWEFTGILTGGLILPQLQLSEPLIVFDATHNGLQKRETTHSLNSVPHAVWKSRLQGKGFSLTNQNRVLVPALLLCLVTAACFPEHLTKILQNLLSQREVLNNQGKIRFVFKSSSVWRILKEEMVTGSFPSPPEQSKKWTSAAACRLWARHEKSFPDWGMCSAGIYHWKRMLKRCGRVHVLGSNAWGGAEPLGSRKPLAGKVVMTVFYFVLNFLVVRLPSLHLFLRSVPSESPYLEEEHCFSFPLDQFQSPQAVSELYLGNASQSRLFLSCPWCRNASSECWTMATEGVSGWVSFVILFLFLNRIHSITCMFSAPGPSASTRGWCQQTQGALRAKMASDPGGSSYGSPWLKCSVSTGGARGRRMHRRREIRSGCTEAKGC